MSDVFHTLQSEISSRETHIVAAKSREQGSQVDLLTEQVEHLTLTCQALWELLKTSHGLTETDLRTRMLEIDSRDGSIDGTIGNEVVDCPHCGKKTGTRKSRCMICGEPVEGRYIFHH